MFYKRNCFFFCVTNFILWVIVWYYIILINSNLYNAFRYGMEWKEVFFFLSSLIFRLEYTAQFLWFFSSCKWIKWGILARPYSVSVMAAVLRLVAVTRAKFVCLYFLRLISIFHLSKKCYTCNNGSNCWLKWDPSILVMDPLLISLCLVSFDSGIDGKKINVECHF